VSPIASLHLSVRGLLCLLLLGVAAAGPALGAAKPAALERVDAAIWDDPQRVVRDAEAALRADDASVDRAALLDAALRLAVAGEMLERTDVAQRGFERGMPLARELHDDGAVCVLYGTEAFIASNSGQVEEAHRRYADALAFANSAGMDWCAARLHLGRGRSYSTFGRGAEALAEMVETHRLYELQHDAGSVAGVLSDMSWIYHREQDNPQSLRRAIESGEAALAMLDPAHQRYLANCVHHNLAGAYLASHLLPQAREHIERAREFAAAVDDIVGIGYIARLHGEIEFEAGRLEQALALFEQAGSVFRQYDVPDMSLKASISQVEVLAALGRRSQARQMLDAAEPLRAKIASAHLDVLYHRAALHLHEGFGDFAKALHESKALGAAQERSVREDNRKAANELQERFETQRRDAENGLLREQQHAAQSQRWLLLATLLLSLALLAATVAYLVQQMRLKKRLAELAVRDDLTGMPNRRSIMETARQVNSDRRGSQQPACIAVLDIDHFKAVNDTYGHDVGDAALITFARVCSANLRSQDRLGRFGGEEFLLVLPGACIADLPVVFERLQSGLRAAVVPGMPADARLSFSMGCALLRADDEVEQAIHRADESLYRAKAEGRDRLAVASAM